MGRSSWAWLCVGRMLLVYVEKREDAKSVVRWVEDAESDDGSGKWR